MKVRLDQLLVDRDIVADVKEAQARILAGEIIVEDRRVDKCGHRFESTVRIRLKTRRGLNFVSRGGLKLEHALEMTKSSVTNWTCLDLGASTGGFTDCLLQRGAKRVYAVDVGYGLLDWRLRTDDRVINLERTHAAHLSRKDIPDLIDFVCADLSFTSLENVIPHIRWCLRPNASGAFLIKPQFEADKSEVSPGGIVIDPQVHKRVCAQIQAAMAELGFCNFNCIESPIKGAKGNVEFVLCCEWSNSPTANTNEA